jgi:uncharacterized protein
LDSFGINAQGSWRNGLTRFLPGCAPIDAFGNGGFRFAGMSHQGSLLIVPSGMRAWRPTAVAEIVADDFAEAVAERSEIDFILIGTGFEMMRLPQTLQDYLGEKSLRFDTMSTSSAIHTYNVVVAEGRRVAAALIAVD